MGIDNIKDIMKYSLILEKELSKNQYKLKELETNPLTNRKEKIHLRNRIRDLILEINRIHEYLSLNTNFKTPEFVEFMAKFLNITEGKYVSSKVLMFKTRYSHYPINGGNIFERYSREGRTIIEGGKFNYFISDDATATFITKNISNESDLNRLLALNFLNDIDYFTEDTFYPFNSDFTFDERVKRHNTLSRAILELIQLKIDNPEISDRERYEIVLNKTKETSNNLKRVLTNY